MNLDLYEFADINRVCAATLDCEAPLAPEAPKSVVGEERTPAALTMIVRAPLRGGVDTRLAPVERRRDPLPARPPHRHPGGVRKTIWVYLRR